MYFSKNEEKYFSKNMVEKFCASTDYPCYQLSFVPKIKKMRKIIIFSEKTRFFFAVPVLCKVGFSRKVCGCLWEEGGGGCGGDGMATMPYLGTFWKILSKKIAIAFFGGLLFKISVF